jgi:hypothetical protein
LFSNHLKRVGFIGFWICFLVLVSATAFAEEIVADDVNVRSSLQSLAQKMQWPAEVIAAPAGKDLQADIYGVASVPFYRLSSGLGQRMAYVYLCSDTDSARTILQKYLDEQKTLGFYIESFELKGFKAYDLFVRAYTAKSRNTMRLNASIDQVIAKFGRYILVAREEVKGNGADALSILEQLYEIFKKSNLIPAPLGKTELPDKKRNASDLPETVRLDMLVPSAGLLNDGIRKWDERIVPLENAPFYFPGARELTEYFSEKEINTGEEYYILLDILGFPTSGGAKARIENAVANIVKEKKSADILTIEGAGQKAYRITAQDDEIVKILFFRENIFVSIEGNTQDKDFNIIDTLFRLSILVDEKIKKLMKSD